MAAFRATAAAACCGARLSNSSRLLVIARLGILKGPRRVSDLRRLEFGLGKKPTKSAPVETGRRGMMPLPPLPT
jgi:hypothetical protein